MKINAKLAFAGGLLGLASVLCVPLLIGNAQAAQLVVGSIDTSPGFGDSSPTPTPTDTGGGGGGPCIPPLICTTPTPTPTLTPTPTPTPTPTIKPTPKATVITTAPPASQTPAETFPTGAPPPGAAGSDTDPSDGPSFGIGGVQEGSPAPSTSTAPTIITKVSKQSDPISKLLLLLIGLGALLGLGGGLGLYLTRGHRPHADGP